ncbi:hypothetical protein BDV96DRAFT_120855 [Lophiotrema nucula]|uniref:Chromo domain-containing protein n=1 Tax=Lophiotrema nucula TaxID=690887 RepID=A0A6A5Z1H0_9PLEO|nr:hypothetical protein BDV96DRAFT_120855 [Lophiotrema nucula]
MEQGQYENLMNAVQGFANAQAETRKELQELRQANAALVEQINGMKQQSNWVVEQTVGRMGPCFRQIYDEKLGPLQEWMSFFPQGSQQLLQQQFQQQQQLWARSHMTASSFRNPTFIRRIEDLVPTIRIDVRSDSDNELAKTMSTEQVLERFSRMEAPFNNIRVAYHQPRTREFWLQTNSMSAYDKLTAKPHAARLPRILGFSTQSAVTAQSIWVLVRGCNLPIETMKACKKLLERWAAETGLKIRDAEYRCHLLLWRFNNVDEATKLCQTWVFFSGTRAYGVPFNRQALPFFCRLCGGPGHMDTYRACPKMNDKTFKRKCIICGSVDHMKERCTAKDRPDSEGYCVNCKVSGHRTESSKCTHEASLRHREECAKIYSNRPLWAASIVLPDPHPAIPYDPPGAKATPPSKKAASSRQLPGSRSNAQETDPLDPAGTDFHRKHDQPIVQAGSYRESAGNDGPPKVPREEWAKIMKREKEGSKKKEKPNSRKTSRASSKSTASRPKTPDTDRRPTSPDKQRASRSPSVSQNEHATRGRSNFPTKKSKRSQPTSQQESDRKGKQKAAEEPPSPFVVEYEGSRILEIRDTKKHSGAGGRVTYLVKIEGMRDAQWIFESTMQQRPELVGEYYLLHPNRDKSSWGRSMRDLAMKAPSGRRSRSRRTPDSRPIQTPEPRRGSEQKVEQSVGASKKGKEKALNEGEPAEEERGEEERGEEERGEEERGEEESSEETGEESSEDDYEASEDEEN